jgi:hypothetical protein
VGRIEGLGPRFRPVDRGQGLLLSCDLMDRIPANDVAHFTLETAGMVPSTGSRSTRTGPGTSSATRTCGSHSFADAAALAVSRVGGASAPDSSGKRAGGRFATELTSADGIGAPGSGSRRTVRSIRSRRILLTSTTASCSRAGEARARIFTGPGPSSTPKGRCSCRAPARRNMSETRTSWL